MKPIENRKVFDLVERMNEIEREIMNLEIEYNKIVKELHESLPNLKGDENIKVKVRKWKFYIILKAKENKYENIFSYI